MPNRTLQSVALAGALSICCTAKAATSLYDRIQDLEENRWVYLSSNRFDDAWPDPLQYAFEGDSNPTVRGSPYALINAWGSFAWDPNRDQIILWGGGHANYAGNEIYLWDGGSGIWSRGSLPSELQEIKKTIVIANEDVEVSDHLSIDGAANSPQSSHTYDNNIFLPLADRFLTFGGAHYSAGGPHFLNKNWEPTGPYLWDPSKADPNKVGGTNGSQVRPEEFPEVRGGYMWENRFNPIPANLRGTTEGATAYAVENGIEVIYIDTMPGLFRYSFNDMANSARDTWEQIGDAYRGLNGGNWYQGPGALDAEEGLFVRIGSDTRSPPDNRFFYYDFADYAPGIPALAMQFEPLLLDGAVFDTQLRNAGMDYDPVRDRFVIWDVNGKLWALTSPQTTPSGQWELGLIDAQAAPQGFPNPSGPNGVGAGTGILGKWEYAPDLDIFLGLFNPYEGGVWAYKPSDWSPEDTPPVVPPVPEATPSPNAWLIPILNLLLED